MTGLLKKRKKEEYLKQATYILFLVIASFPRTCPPKIRLFINKTISLSTTKK